MEMSRVKDDQLTISYKDLKSKLLLGYCRFYCKIQAHLLKFPRYTRKYYLENISTLASNQDDQDDRDELKTEKQIWRNWTPFNQFGNLSLVLAVYFSFLVTKYTYFICYTLTNVDFKQPDENIVKVPGGVNEHQFACMRTNCSRLSRENELAQDLIQLPVFSICQANISWWYNPLINSHQIGLILTAIFMFFLFVAAVLEPPIAHSSCIHFRLATFLVCPNVVRRLELERTKRLCLEFADSYKNYQSSVSLMLLSSHGRRFSFLTNLKRTQSLSINPMDCLPINGTKWWHGQLVSCFPLITSLQFLLVTILMLVFNQWAHSILSENHEVCYYNYHQFVDIINNNNNNNNNSDHDDHDYTNSSTQEGCSIWSVATGENNNNNNDNNSINRVEPNEIAREYNAFTAIEFFFSMLIINLTLVISLNGFYQTANDIQIYINELKFQLEIANQLANLRLVMASNGCHSSARTVTRESSMFEAIRARIVENSSYSSGVIITKPLKRLAGRGRATTTELEHKLACEELAFDLLDQFGWSGEVYADLLEKIQINYWNFAQSISDHERPLSGLLFFCYLINFGFSLIAVYMSRRFLAHQLLSLLVNIIAVMTLNLYIASASIVHSQAKGLEFKWWSLLALNCNESNERIRHTNHLAGKQLKLIDSGGGLALRAFGYNVTYVRIIEVSFWTTSIILLAYTRH